MTGPKLLVACAPGVGLLTWGGLRQPGHYVGLAVAVAAVTLLWPLLILAVLLGPPALARGFVPRRWRIRYRRRRYIPAWLRRCVYAADRHRCVYCRSTLSLQADHYLPWSLGGLTTVFNLFALCQPCNAAKSSYWRYRSGLVVPGYGDPVLAELIARAERRTRRNPLRWLRAAWAL